MRSWLVNGVAASLLLIEAVAGCSRHPSARSSQKNEVRPGAPRSTALPSHRPVDAGRGDGVRCAVRDLHLSWRPYGGSAGQFYSQVEFRNTATAPCDLRGYPRISYVDATGRRVGYAAVRWREPHNPVRTVRVEPDRYAHVTLDFPDPGMLPSNDCQLAAVSAWRISLPARARSTMLRLGAGQACTQRQTRMATGPIEPGR